MSDDFYAEKLIDAGRSRLCLWDISDDEYRDKHKKKEVWSEVCLLCYPYYHYLLSTLRTICKITSQKPSSVCWMNSPSSSLFSLVIFLLVNNKCKSRRKILKSERGAVSVACINRVINVINTQRDSRCDRCVHSAPCAFNEPKRRPQLPFSSPE